MTPADVIAEAERRGIVLRLRRDGLLNVHPASALTPGLLAAIRSLKTEILALLPAGENPPEASTAPATPGESLPPPSDARGGKDGTLEKERPPSLPAVPAPVTRHTPSRQTRTLAALSAAVCRSCGFSFWRVNGRGHASCVACRRLLEGLPLTCAHCGRSDGWRTGTDGRKSCSCEGRPRPITAGSAFRCHACGWTTVRLHENGSPACATCDRSLSEEVLPC